MVSQTCMIRSRIASLIDHWQPSETVVLIGPAIVVGLGTGLGAVLFIQLIALIEGLLFGSFDTAFPFLGRTVLIIAPALGGLLAGPIIAYFAKEAKGHGVPEVMAAIALRGGRIRPRVAMAKVVASALCIGSGGSAGREGPIVQVGSALGSTIGQVLRLSDTRIKNLVACGAAAGIAATFNAPIAGVIFTVEIILGELHMGYLGNVIISAVTASTVARIFLGNRPAFSLPDYNVRSPWEVLLYAVLGVLAALAAVGFTRLLYWFEDRFDGWRFPDVLKPAVGGLMLGVLAFLYPLALASSGISPTDVGIGLPLASHLPQVFGSGFTTIQQALLGGLPFAVLLALVLLKPLATSLTLGSGNSGGVFAPSLFLGAVLGGAFGWLVETIAPGATAGPGAFAAVGMASVFAGAARAPFTAILIVFEMTDDYYLILPLMAGVISCYLLAEHLLTESIYTLKLSRRGIRLQRGRDVDVMETVHVEEVMVRQPPTVPVDLPASSLVSEFLRTGRHGFPVLDAQGGLFGMVSLDDYRRTSEGKKEPTLQQLSVGDIATCDLVSVFPDETVGVALRRMAPRDLGRLPVVARDDPRRLLGVVRRNDIIRAHELGIVRREDARQYAEQAQSSADARARFVEIMLTTDSGAVGKSVVQLNLPRGVVVVSIRRGKDLLIPRGDTQLRAGDILVALCKQGSAETLRDILGPPHTSDGDAGPQGQVGAPVADGPVPDRPAG